MNKKIIKVIAYTVLAVVMLLIAGALESGRLEQLGL